MHSRALAGTTVVQMEPADGISAFPAGDNLMAWTATIEGSDGTVYEGLSYELSLSFSVRPLPWRQILRCSGSNLDGALRCDAAQEKYPYEPPTVKFQTACFHPNVDTAGNICLDILKDKWSVAMCVRTVLVSIQSLLGDPNNDSPLNSFAASLWENQAEYKATLHKKYAEAPAATEKVA